MDVKITLKVPIEIVGIARGVKADAGILDLVTREVEIECLPSDIPARIAVDVSDLGIGDAIRVAQIPAVEGVRVVDNPEKVVVHVAHPTREEEPVAAAEGAAEPAEPEVLKKGKVVSEEEAGDEKAEKKDKKEKEKEK
jgi:large subunit ribosomal protein L25